MRGQHQNPAKVGRRTDTEIRYATMASIHASQEERVHAVAD